MATPTLKVTISRVNVDGEQEIRRITAVESPALAGVPIDGMVKKITDHLYDQQEVREVDVLKVLG